MKRVLTWVGLALLMVTFVAITAPAATAQAPAATTPVTLEVYDPSGAFEVTQLFAPRLDDLNGKTICEVSDNLWETQRTFPLIRSLLQKQYPTMKIIPYDQMPEATTDAASGLGDKVKKVGCQGVIVGNAG